MAIKRPLFPSRDKLFAFTEIDGKQHLIHKLDMSALASSGKSSIGLTTEELSLRFMWTWGAVPTAEFSFLALPRMVMQLRRHQGNMLTLLAADIAKAMAMGRVPESAIKKDRTQERSIKRRRTRDRGPDYEAN